MFLAIAHRGDPLVHPENTLASLRSAIDKGANALEFDLRLTKDGQVVLSHDATLERVWTDPAPVASLTPQKLRARQADGVAVPTLDEVLAEVGEMLMVVDLKTDDVIDPVLDVLRRHDGGFERAIFVAARRGGQQALVRLRAAAPNAVIGLDWSRR